MRVNAYIKVGWEYLFKVMNLFLPTTRAKTVAILLCGVFVGLVAYMSYASRAYSYLLDDPDVCINCHIMGPFYATWKHSSHGRDTVCNDCHVPQDNIFRKWYFKAKDGSRHAEIFTLRGEHQVITAIPESQGVIQENCVRCHTQLNTEFVKPGCVSARAIESGEGKACWDCHQEVPHGGRVSLSATMDSRVPFPKSIVPKWLEKELGTSNKK